MSEHASERLISSVPGAPLRELADVQFWLRELGCTEDELRAAIKAVGVLPRLLPLQEKLLAAPRSR